MFIKLFICFKIMYKQHSCAKAPDKLILSLQEDDSTSGDKECSYAACLPCWTWQQSTLPHVLRFQKFVGNLVPPLKRIPSWQLFPWWMWWTTLHGCLAGRGTAQTASLSEKLQIEVPLALFTTAGEIFSTSQHRVGPMCCLLGSHSSRTSRHSFSECNYQRLQAPMKTLQSLSGKQKALCSTV